ncbi:baseplate multidomain protein megatron [Methylobacterium oryzihabitans]|uniref:Uncharacterized protein n=1 Tax=Methylobacterium oryzihabitans TaxID=2499852 RepID=A0A437P5F8_9HYPH|nr:glycoside hydrolase/phage tail family protein [Methylobacterium oryzihabitans]RVU17509.1 hypothetical protein EOE48_14065 [Methylobacterium oryzihabitans]
MSTLVLSYAGKAAGTALGGPLGGLLGGVAGTLAGGLLDRALFGSRPKPQINTGPRLTDLYVTASTEGAAVARVYGRTRVAGQILWATKLKETQHVERVKTSGGKGMPTQKTFNVTYSYSVSVAVALCEGPISGLGQVYADGTPLVLARYVHRLYLGGEDQGPDPKIEAVEGAGRAPAYRGLAYLVFEDLPLAAFGNRVPVITAEIIRRPPAVTGTPVLEELMTAVTLIPAMGEFVYATVPVTASPGLGSLSGQNTVSGGIDLARALDQLQAEAPQCRHVSLVVAWHGTDLRLDACRILPKVERAAKVTSHPWQAGGLTREGAPVVSLLADGTPAVGGAPADWSVVQAIHELKRRGFLVTLYPFVMMDIPAGNGLPDPYGGAEQAAFPWRGRITCHPAPGRPGSPDKTGAAADAVAAFFGTTTGADLAWTGATVTSAKPAEWSFSRFILTCARLAEAAGGVDSFLIGSEMIGLTTLRSDSSTFPAVARLRALAAEARAILGPGTAIGYGADWTEYASHRPADGSGDVFFHLDPLWADPAINFVGIDNYMPLADWRDGFDHLDARAGTASTCDPAYLRANVAGGEGFDWYYASLADRDAQIRTPIADTAHGEHWVFRVKDLRGWWSNAHHDRPGGVRAATPTAWVPGSKPVWFTELGCPAVDKGANQPNVFVDPKSSESFLPYYSTGRQDLAVQRAALEAVLAYWRDPAVNPAAPAYGGRMVAAERIYLWTWDARPYPEFPLQRGAWADAANYHLGHWLNGRLGLPSLAAVVADLCAGSGAAVDVSRLVGVVQGYAITDVQALRDSLAPLRTAFFFDGAESQGRLVFAPLAGPVAASFGPDELVASEGGSDLTRTRGEETALPGVLALSYLDPTRAYQTAAVEARRLDGRAASVSRVSLPLALDTGAARGLARALLYQAVTERESVVTVLPPSALALDPGDVVAIGAEATEYRLTRLGHERGRPASGVRVDAGVFAYRDGNPEAREPSPPVVAGVGLFEVLDLPMLRSAAIPHAPYLAAYTAPWSPVAVQRSVGGGAFEDDATLGARSIVGRLTAPLHRGPAGRWDRVNTLHVEVPAGAELAAATDLAVLAGANVAALRLPSGEWEVLQWAGAVLAAPGRYRLSRLLRGQLGTEAVMADVIPAGAAFVVLTDALVQSGAPLATRTLPQVVRWGPLGEPPDAASWQAAPLTVRGVGLRPYAPAHARARRLGNGDLALTWIRRTRLDGDAWEQAEVPLAEEREAYELDVLAGDGSVLRTLAASEPAVTYTAAMQAADAGGPVAAVSLALFQLSTTWGRGAALRTTLHL